MFLSGTSCQQARIVADASFYISDVEGLEDHVRRVVYEDCRKDANAWLSEGSKVIVGQDSSRLQQNGKDCALRHSHLGSTASSACSASNGLKLGKAGRLGRNDLTNPAGMLLAKAG
jgi:hypothetical protein